MKLNDQQLEYVITSVREHEAHEAADRLMEHIAALEAELARLKPTGQVAEDEKELRWTIERAPMDPGAVAEDLVRLERLAAQAQGYEAIRKALSDNYGTDGDPLERVKDLLESEEAARNEAAVEQAERHRVEGERDAAVADNAADAILIGKLERRDVGWPEALEAYHAQPHPGAALLEQHRKEVAQARNEALEEAADMAWVNDPDSELADAIRRKKAP